MMGAQSVLDQLRNLGLTISIEDDRLAVKPASWLTPELSQAIREHKPDLMRLLDADREGPPYPDGLSRVKCFYCENCEITGTKATCRVSRESVSGIALLISCSDFTLTTVH
jgi:hypothetical protein